ncbi:hypothetical protein [Chromobacterium haemolyticum]|uniref:hypothetical protein n=1 Tax=Chromobacterium haemolyticum TaxID=394935 RepID=UPI00244ACFE8|nr:hypothetical protein [Chromobacterium haemolyticum]MDH0342126.1 hypothetical protein [Chromobacterium haemolyticum]
MQLPPIDVDEAAGTNVLVVDFAPGVLKGDPRPDEPSMCVVEGPHIGFAKPGQCRHLNVRVNEDLAEVTCRDCEAKLNPIWVLSRMAKEETKWAFRRSEFIKTREALAQRSRCKCQHCGQMTRIKV